MQTATAPIFHRGLAHMASTYSQASIDSNSGNDGTDPDPKEDDRLAMGPGVAFQRLLDQLGELHAATLAENLQLRNGLRQSPAGAAPLRGASPPRPFTPTAFDPGAPPPSAALPACQLKSRVPTTALFLDASPGVAACRPSLMATGALGSFTEIQENGQHRRVSRKELQIKRKYKAVFKDSGTNNCSVAWQLEKMLAQSKGRMSAVYEEDFGVAKAVQALNEALSKPERNHDDDMSFETFFDLMTEDLSCMEVDEEAAQRIHEIRAMFAQRDMAKIVADHTHTNAETLAARNEVRESMAVKCLDWIGLIMILSNAVVLAVSPDSPWEGWRLVEICFTAFFFFELCTKFMLAGLHKPHSKGPTRYSLGLSVVNFFNGLDRTWNIADAVIVGVAVIDMAISEIQTSQGADRSGGPWALMRLFRLARITKLMRVLRYKIFKELLLMIKGVISGLRTLIWAIVLLAMVICIVGLIFRLTLGDWCGKQVENSDGELVQHDWCDNEVLKLEGKNLFGTFPRSSFTIYRCFTEGCATYLGTPLLVHIWENKGGEWIILAYILTYLAVTFGLFNLIMAVFVENTMEAAKHDEKRRKQLRAMQQLEMARKLQKLVVHFCQEKDVTNSAEEGMDRKNSSQRSKQGTNAFGHRWSIGGLASCKQKEPEIPKVANLDQEITRDMFENAFADPETEVLLEDLDITLDDPMNLFEALDADGGGTIDVSELIKGLMKLLGSTDNVNNNMVAALLSVRSMQKCLREFDGRAQHEHKQLVDANGRLEARLRDCTSSSQKAVLLAEKAAQQVEAHHPTRAHHPSPKLAQPSSMQL